MKVARTEVLELVIAMPSALGIRVEVGARASNVSCVQDACNNAAIA
jgi:hypothetical protein